jgi:hypothetical protein
MIYGSTGATHFDQLAKILTGYEITGARSSGICMGLLFIAVGFLFKITAVPFRAADGRPRYRSIQMILAAANLLRAVVRNSSHPRKGVETIACYAKAAAIHCPP